MTFRVITILLKLNLFKVTLPRDIHIENANEYVEENQK